MLKKWLRLATKPERERVAAAASTSVAYLEHLAADEAAAYRRQPKVSLAAAIERETEALAKESKGRLPVVRRTELVGACSTCPYARKCLGGEADAAVFPVID
jgi:hypothetical protein